MQSADFETQFWEMLQWYFLVFYSYVYTVMLTILLGRTWAFRGVASTPQIPQIEPCLGQLSGRKALVNWKNWKNPRKSENLWFICMVADLVWTSKQLVVRDRLLFSWIFCFTYRVCKQFIVFPGPANNFFQYFSSPPLQKNNGQSLRRSIYSSFKSPKLV